ncbi:hypothetical protein LFT48_21705 (plasmid) [Arthrobacter sp. FW305-123]|nr:hypothetical protein LFT48_21705 [Arthrobacter sp. FW305-123]
MKAATITAAVAGTLLLGATLAGCVSPIPPQQNSGTPSPALPTPTKVVGPDSREDCTTSLRKSLEGLEDPDRVTIRCAGTTITVAGNFRDRYTNAYDPETAQDIEKIIVVGGEVRAWVRYGDTTCLIIHTPGTTPVQCKPTQEQQAEKPPTPGPTVQPTPTSSS